LGLDHTITGRQLLAVKGLARDWSGWSEKTIYFEKIDCAGCAGNVHGMGRCFDLSFRDQRAKR
jgi:hypothetical protein